MYHTDETIAAIASAAGGAGRGIVRLSGPAVIPIIERCFRVPSEAGSLRAIRVATAVAGTLQLVESPLDALPVDLYLWPSARSYTRQPAAEIHATGSPPLLSAILRTVCAHGARLAEPGEFTLRAFLAGRLDLTQAEAVLGVIDARGQPEFEGALEQLAGGLRRCCTRCVTCSSICLRNSRPVSISRRKTSNSSPRTRWHWNWIARSKASASWSIS